MDVDTRPRPHCLIHDAYDGTAFARVRERSGGLARVIEAGRLRMPDLDVLVEDLFYAFYKGNVVFRPIAEIPGSGRVHRRLLGEVVEASGFAATRRHTMLDEEGAATAAAAVGDRILELLRREHLLLDDEILAAHQLQRDEHALAVARAHRDALDEMRQRKDGPPLDPKVTEDLSQSLDDEVASLQRAVRRATREADAVADDIPASLAARVRGAVGELPRRLMELEADVENFGRSVGLGERLDAQQRIALGEHLLRSEKLRKLAALVGAFRQFARVERRRKLPRRASAVYDIGFGDDPARLLASELSGLRHPVLRRDVRRRFVEGRLLQYELEGPDDRGRGPIVVCLDGSGSMSGPKELWSKAVALTLLDIARRQRRALRVIQFSAPPQPLHVRDLVAPRPGVDGRHPADPEAIVEFAEHFPGGGTEFQAPLDAALEALHTSRFRRGDIVFVTDGQCQIGADFVERLDKEKRRLGFRIQGVLVDVGASTPDTLARFADEVHRVRELTADAAGAVFDGVERKS